MPRTPKRTLTRAEWIEVGNDLKTVKDLLWKTTKKLQGSLPLSIVDKFMKFDYKVNLLMAILETPLAQQHPEWSQGYLTLEGPHRTSELAKSDPDPTRESP